MDNKKKKNILIIAVLAFILLIVGGTYAFITWSSNETQQTNVTFTVTPDFSCSADAGGHITSNDRMLAPTDCMDPEYAIQRTINTNVTNSGTSPVYLSLWLDIKELGTNLSNSQNFMYALTTSSAGCNQGEVIASGSFNGLAANDKVDLLEGVSYNTSGTGTYYLYVWLDEAETSTDTMNQTFNLQLGGECTTQKPIAKPNKPVLDAGMIPVKMSDSGVVTAVSQTDPTWYDYDNKQWANAVLVKENGVKTRAANKVAGTTIDSSDILAYYVWIPRYAYKVWQYEGVAASVPNPLPSIDIVFQKKTEKSTATKVDDYYTHPAFTFGTEELSGIWVGKFETTGSAATPTILPNLSSLRNQTICAQFVTALKFAGGSILNDIVSFAGSSTYGLANTTDSHMMKNSEWGAVAYLSHSKYGKNSEVRKNNNRNFTTGCGASADNGSSTTECQIAYGSGVSSYPQSTTGKISGVFDMSGGTLEYVMANYNNTRKQSGFNSTWFTTTGNSKYYDLYSITSAYSCTLATCGGHALNETRLWYSDSPGFVDSKYPWFVRGGSFTDGNGSGAFQAHTDNGGSTSYSFRSVLVAR